MSNAPTKLNGYPVIKYTAHSNGYVTVMVERDDDHMRYVVASWYPELKRGWIWGHYSATLEEAYQDYSEVEKRNRGRGGNDTKVAVWE